jgi:hypothetical protein
MKDENPESESQKDKINNFLDALTWYHNSKQTPIGFYNTVGRIEKKFDPFLEKMDSLIKSIKSADKSSTELTRALNRITLAGVIIAAFGIIIAGLNLGFDIYKYIH